MTTLRKKIRIMKAAEKGAPIQRKYRIAASRWAAGKCWTDDPRPAWNWGLFKYRVTPPGCRGD